MRRRIFGAMRDAPASIKAMSEGAHTGEQSNCALTVHREHRPNQNAFLQVRLAARTRSGIFPRMSRTKRIAPPQPRYLGRHFIRQWREFRGLTQEALAARVGERLGTSFAHTTLGRIENFRLPYNQVSLEAIAAELGCHPWELLNSDPYRKEADLGLDNLPPEARAQARDFIRFLASKQA